MWWQFCWKDDLKECESRGDATVDEIITLADDGESASFVARPRDDSNVVREFVHGLEDVRKTFSCTKIRDLPKPPPPRPPPIVIVPPPTVPPPINQPVDPPPPPPPVEEEKEERRPMLYLWEYAT